MAVGAIPLLFQRHLHQQFAAFFFDLIEGGQIVVYSLGTIRADPMVACIQRVANLDLFVCFDQLGLDLVVYFGMYDQPSGRCAPLSRCYPQRQNRCW